MASSRSSELRTPLVLHVGVTTFPTARTAGTTVHAAVRTADATLLMPSMCRTDANVMAAGASAIRLDPAGSTVGCDDGGCTSKGVPTAHSPATMVKSCHE